MRVVLQLAMHAADDLLHEVGPAEPSLDTHLARCSRVYALWQARMAADGAATALLGALRGRWSRDVVGRLDGLCAASSGVQVDHVHACGRAALAICVEVEHVVGDDGLSMP